MLETCVAIAASKPVPGWVMRGLPDLPAELAETDRRAARVERACVDAVEDALLAAHAGAVFDAVVVDGSPSGALVIQIPDPAVVVAVSGDGSPGRRVRIRVDRGPDGHAALQIV